MSAPSPRVAPRARVPALARVALVPLVFAPAWATPVAAQGAPTELARVVPSDAYSYMRYVADPSMDFVHEHNMEVWQAVKDARFHEIGLDVMRRAGAPEADIAQVEALHDVMTGLISSVDWLAMVEHEVVYAEIAAPPILGVRTPPGLSSYLFACRPHLDKVPDLERSVVDLMSVTAGMADEIELVDEVRPGDVTTRVYTLAVDEGSMRMPLIQFAVRGDVIMAGFGAGAFERSLALLEGRSDDALVDSDRFRMAVGETQTDSPQFMYFDVELLIDSLFEQVGGIILAETGDDWRVRNAIEDVHGLVDFVDTMVTTVHAEDRMLVSECWTRFDPIAAGSGNPLYASYALQVDGSELLDYVPADATSFSMHGGLDLRPLYDWGFDRVKAYVPDAEDNLLMYEGAQALLDISVRDDILSWVGSESISISMPARSGPGGEDWVTIVRLRDPDGARKVLGRIESVWQTLVPPLIKRLEREKGATVVMPQVTIRDAEGSLPSMKRVSISFEIPNVNLPIPPIPDLFVGILGNQLILTTSEAALLNVMDVAAGEEPGLWEHPALSDTRMPEGPVTRMSLQPVGRQIQEAAQAFQVAGGVMGMLMSQGNKSDPQGAMVIDATSQVMSRMAKIFQSMDFLDDEVSYGQLRQDGLVSYSRTTTQYVDE